jgi:membrane protein
MAQLDVNRLRAAAEQADRGLIAQLAEVATVPFAMHRIFDIDLTGEVRNCVLAEFRQDRPGLYQADMDAAAGQFQPLYGSEPLKGVFRGDIGAPPAIRQHTQNRGAVYDPAMALPTHCRQSQTRQSVPSEKIRLELLAKDIGLQVLHRASLRIGAVIEHCVQRAASRGQHGRERALNRFRFGVVEINRREARIGQHGEIGLVSRGCEYGPAGLPQAHCAVAADSRGTAGDKDGFCHWLVIVLCRVRNLDAPRRQARSTPGYLQVQFFMAIRGYAVLFSTAFVNGFAHFNEDDGWAIASHVALSGLMAMFPFLIFCTALAAYVDLGDFPDTLVELMFEYWPDRIATPLARQVSEVLTQPRGDVLTFGAAAALFFASSGVEALRLGLNRAYRVTARYNFLVTRLQSIVFVVVAAFAVATVTFLLLLLPLFLEVAKRHFPILRGYAATIEFWRLVVSVAILFLALYVSHKWLAAGKRKLREVFPGIVFTLFCWMLASVGFSFYLQGFASYVSTYAGLASIFMALVYFYMLSVILLLGAEINAAMTKVRMP